MTYWNGLKMDKNKAAFKLKGIPPIYYLNLDGQEDRRIYMENQFKYWEIENYAVSYTHLTLPTICSV